MFQTSEGMDNFLSYLLDHFNNLIHQYNIFISENATKNADKSIIERLYKVARNTWKSKELTQEWMTAIICLIFKERDPQLMNNECFI